LQKFNTYQVGDVGVSSITVAELEFGVRKSQFPARNQQALTQFLLPLKIVDFDRAAAIIYGDIRAMLEKQGNPIGSLDTLIAAHAVSLEVTLVTNNFKEFNRVSNLQLENWVN
ncbi:MAG: type II toxin-antitoxin system VapC family toxin, partial [Cyanobacteria bacterium P01_F01_bin.143]